jgi:predicted AAA+ superfamily ATPase
VHCLDTGLACGLSGIRSPRSIDPSFRGRLFETLVFQHLAVIASLNGGHLYYLRKQGGLEREIDFVIEIDGRILTVEAKASDSVGPRDAENMTRLRELLPDWHGGLVIYNGTEIRKLRREILAVPLSAL